MLTKEEVLNLDSGDRYKIYFHYLLKQLSLKHSFHVRDIAPWRLTESNTNGWGEPDKTFGNIELRYLWKGLRYYTFEEFQEVRPNTHGYLPLWEHYWRFADEIQL